MLGHSAKAIANAFIERARDDGRALTQMQLQKLVYIAHGWSLTLRNAPLTHSELRAWDFGPVYPDLYSVLRKYGSDEVTTDICENDGNIFASTRGKPIRVKLSTDEADLIKYVWDEYGEFKAFQLSALTHKPNTPWHKVFREGEGRSEVIGDELIQDHFNELAELNAA